jgi:hypothetical protein
MNESPSSGTKSRAPLKIDRRATGFLDSAPLRSE